jgi:hypothetical protein
LPQSILFARKSVVSLMSDANLMHNKKINVHIIIDSESDEEMSNTTAKVMTDE